MTPAPGPTGAGIPAQVGPYRIERELARGGMGIVYLARDTRLDRAVAIKALPDDVAADPDRLARFEREAKTLASLNHPNIAGIYGVEESGGRRYLVLEHVEGETLAARLVRGPLPLAETQEICLQIAAGVEAAHENGVIHRDLKPGNVMITPGDHVKVLDFGLAKGKVAADDRDLLANSPTLTESPVLPQSPTVQSPATLPGVILGTAAYLSPEQARGKAVDRRTDIWSFGCVLYECLTGKRAFEGETVSDTIARILERDVEWARLPKTTPTRIRELLKRCLEKDPRKRLRDIGEARLVLEQRAGTDAADAGAYAAAEPAAAPKPLSRMQRLFEGRGGILFGIGLAVGAALGIKLWGGGGDLASSMHRADRGVVRLSHGGADRSAACIRSNHPGRGRDWGGSAASSHLYPTLQQDLVRAGSRHRRRHGIRVQPRRALGCLRRAHLRADGAGTTLQGAARWKRAAGSGRRLAR